MANVKVNSDGSVVENTITETKANPASDLYALVERDLKNVAYAFVDTLEAEAKDDESDLSEVDEDTEQYAKFLNNLEDYIESNGNSLGDIQATATDFGLSGYEKFVGVGESIPTAEPTEYEQQLINKGGVLSNISSSKTDFSSASDIPVPTVEGERIPVLVMSNEANEKLHTFEEAKELVLDLIETHLDLEVSESEESDAEESNDTNNDDGDSSSDSDRPSVNDPTTIEGVGPATVEKIESNGFEIVPGLDREEHIEAEPFGFEKSDTNETPDLTTPEVKERYDDVKEQMDDLDTECVRQRIIDGDLYDAVEIIEQYE